jgi:hypothetical protein
MDALLQALAHEARRQIVRELRRSPGATHAQLLALLEFSKAKAGQLTKLIAPLESAGVIMRDGSKYYVVDDEGIRRLLSAAADVNVSAQRTLAQRAQDAVGDAERIATELRAE